MKKKTPEGLIKDLVQDYLTARGILWFRMQTGAAKAIYQGKSRMIRYGTPGMGDLLAFPITHSYIYALGKTLNYSPTAPVISEACMRLDGVMPLWLEIKSAKGSQSELQKSFQQLVESRGHRYAVISSLEELIEALSPSDESRTA